MVGDRNHFLTLDVNPHSSLVRLNGSIWKHKRKREMQCGKRSRASLLRGGVLHVEEEYPRSWRSTRNFPALVTLLRTEWPKSHLVDDCGSGTWQRCAILSRARPLWTTLLFHARYSYLHYTSECPKWLGIHAPMEGFETWDRAVTQA